MSKPDQTGDEFSYIHGFSEEEQERLSRQAAMAEPLIYKDIEFFGRQDVLEVGSGVGAQSEVLLRRFPDIQLTCVDLSQAQLDAAKENLASRAWLEGRYQLLQMDATDLEFESRQFDGAFLCWVLEHVPDPCRVLNEVRRVLKPGGRVYATEVMNSSFFLNPYSPCIWKYWMAFNDHQYEVGGDPFVGAKLGNCLLASGFQQVETRIKTFHYDNRHPDKRRNMLAYWEELLLSAEEQLLDSGKVDQQVVDNMREEFHQVRNDPDAVFFYSFVQATAVVY